MTEREEQRTANSGLLQWLVPVPDFPTENPLHVLLYL